MTIVNGRYVDPRPTTAIQKLEPGMRVVFRGEGWDDPEYGEPGEMTAPERSNDLFWDNCEDIVTLHWRAVTP